MLTYTWLLFAALAAIASAKLNLQGYASSFPAKDHELGSWKMIDVESKDLKHHLQTKHTFYVAMKLRNKELLHNELMDISDPKSMRYAKYYSIHDIKNNFGPTDYIKLKMENFLSNLDGVYEFSLANDMVKVTASIESIENVFGTKLRYLKRELDSKKSLKAVETLTKVPNDLHEHISYISLNTPIHSLQADAYEMKINKQNNNLVNQVMEVMEYNVSTYQTTASAALIGFTPICPSKSLITDCDYKITVTSYNSNYTYSYLINTDGEDFSLKFNENLICTESNTGNSCTISTNCTCLAKIAPLDKYIQLRFEVYAIPTDLSITSYTSIGKSYLQALTDTATPEFLKNLYNVPLGISVRHGSNQSVAEFYGQFYSNSDLELFLSNTGLSVESIPVSNVYGDLVDDESNPGYEAQLDVEYIMAMATNADTFFYSFGDLNPYDISNEGFLSYLYFVGNQTHPPLVHSLSYGDVEAAVFNTTNPDAYEYGERCDQQFALMGLRGLTLLFSSGDDGVGNFVGRTDPILACSQTWPSWPAASPYVLAVGGTQMTSNYNPVCGNSFKSSMSLPLDMQLQVDCSGEAETTCSASFGGVITSGGGFSNVNARTLSPWQEEMVSAYLSNYSSSLPPSSYYNSNGRGYPDVATYASNYFINIFGENTLVSGTSASAPTMAAMVTLWNDLRLAYNYPSLGFINPFLYSIAKSTPEAFHDITTGDNACGVGDSIENILCCTYSFHAQPGWDATTGLGSPNFDVIANLVLNADSYFPALGAYPDGTTTNDNDNNDDSHDKMTRSIAIAGLFFALLSFLLIIYSMFRNRKTTKDALLFSSTSYEINTN